MEESGIAERKRALRRSMTLLRDGLPAEERAERSVAACGHAADWLAAIGASSFLAYASFRTELDTLPLLRAGWERGIAVLLPKCEPQDRSMTIYRVRGLDELTRGAYGLPEPDDALAERWTCLDGIGAVLVPGLAFDRAGGRLGYGGGYYDRFREAASEAFGSRSGGLVRTTPWMGLCFGMQVAASRLPAEAHDVRLDGYITEQGIHYRAGSGRDEHGADAF